MYQKIESEMCPAIRHVETDRWIPLDEANTDYQRYLEWVAAGGVPEPWNGA